MEFVIITGMSGAGKSRAMDTFEDMGYYCVDNLPIDLIGKFAELCVSGGRYEYVAIAADVRGGDIFNELLNNLADITRLGLDYTIFYLEANTEVLISRYKESRRKHPLETGTVGIDAAIDRERGLLAGVRAKADHIIDTSYLATSSLRDYIINNFKRAGTPASAFVIRCMSFGFKYGIPIESDLVFDVRFLPNPFYIPALKKQTGLDAPVYEYVHSQPETAEFLKRLFDLLDYTLPKYVAEGKSSLVISIGCTGGQHRSVALTEDLCEHLNAQGYFAAAEHRDIKRNG